LDSFPETGAGRRQVSRFAPWPGRPPRILNPEPRLDPSKSLVRSPAASGAEAAAETRALVEQARNGDQAAFGELVTLHRDRAYGLALRILRSAADAEEVAQDAFVRAWLALPRFREESSFSTWLWRIVARRAFDRWATLRSRGAREAGLEDLPGEAAAPDEPVRGEAGRRARRMERLVGELPAAQRAAVTLYYYENGSVDEVAKVLEIPVGTVKTHLSRARAALREAWLREEAKGADHELC
jgi:RNA polymerase sigma-70 factor (ECF subfamily)